MCVLCPSTLDKPSPHEEEAGAQRPRHCGQLTGGGDGAVGKGWDLLGQAPWPSFQLFTQVTQSLTHSGLQLKAPLISPEPESQGLGWEMQPGGSTAHEWGVLHKSVTTTGMTASGEDTRAVGQDSLYISHL